MTPRPLHRSKTLWLGILILVFLLWAWARSQSHFDFLNYRLASRSWDGFSNSGGHVRWATSTFASLPGATNHIRWGSIAVINDHWFPPPFEAKRALYGIAHWLLILLFLLIWTTLLAWRWHRIRRPTKTTASPAPDA